MNDRGGYTESRRGRSGRGSGNPPQPARSGRPDERPRRGTPDARPGAGSGGRSAPGARGAGGWTKGSRPGVGFREFREPDPSGLVAGTVVRLRVDREVSPNGYYLTDGKRDVLLHYSEAEGKVSPGDEVDVFLFHDTQDRLAATMKQPNIRLGELALLEVVDSNPKLGCFLDMGLGRHLLLPRTELPELEAYRPLPGDRVYVTLGHDRQGRMIAKAAGEQALAAHVFPAPAAWKGTTVRGIVYKSLKIGSFVIFGEGPTGFGAFGFIHDDERTKPLRMGETVEARVAFVREDGRANLSMSPQKELRRDDDAEKLLRFLRERPGGSMPYSDQTPSDIIRSKFGMSKASFKRALGKLMKEGLAEQSGNWTKLTDK